MISKKELVAILEQKCYCPTDIKDWLSRSNPFFKDRTPLQMIKDKDTGDIEQFIKKLKDGPYK